MWIRRQHRRGPLYAVLAGPFPAAHTPGYAARGIGASPPPRVACPHRLATPVLAPVGRDVSRSRSLGQGRARRPVHLLLLCITPHVGRDHGAAMRFAVYARLTVLPSSLLSRRAA